MQNYQGIEGDPTQRQFMQAMRGIKVGAPLLGLFEQYADLNPSACELKERSMRLSISDVRLPTNHFWKFPHELVAVTNQRWIDRVKREAEPEKYAPLTLVISGRGGFFQRLTVMVCPHPDENPLFGVPEADPVGYLEVGWDMYPYPKRVQNMARARAKISMQAEPAEMLTKGSREENSFNLLTADLTKDFTAFIGERRYTVKSAPWAQLAAIDTTEMGWIVYSKAKRAAQGAGTSLLSRFHSLNPE